jgi:NADPH:quinone reductase-like Zn-dependent oxidoreductase
MMKKVVIDVKKTCLPAVLVHAGGSGVGTAAVQLVSLFGGRSIVTAGSQDKIDKVTKRK